ncbi:hypothetical protein Tco_0559624 [Tanacetum coccineum]
MYVVRCTRPDVAFAQNLTSRDVYVYGGDIKRELRVSYYTDAGYQTDADDLKSQTGYVFVLNGEAEYIAASNASKGAVWVRKFISGLGVVPTIEEPIKIYCDSTGAITIANESGITKGARHYHAKVHYLREVIEFGDIKMEKVHTDDNLTDPFTKALAFPKHSEHTRPQTTEIHEACDYFVFVNFVGITFINFVVELYVSLFVTLDAAFFKFDAMNISWVVDDIKSEFFVVVVRIVSV